MASAGEVAISTFHFFLYDFMAPAFQRAVFDGQTPCPRTSACMPIEGGTYIVEKFVLLPPPLGWLSLKLSRFDRINYS